MTNVKIRIEVNPNSESENLGDIQNQVDGIPSSENVSNVSVKINGEGLFQELPNKSGGINGLSLAGDLVFNEFGVLDNPNLQGAVLESTESPVEFIWGVVPDSGEYKVRLVFTDAKSLKDVIIYGDSVVNQFPTQAKIDGAEIIYNDDLQWAISFANESDTHTIEFTHWNLKNYNACISKIAVMLKYLEIDKHNGLKEIESTSQSSSDTTGLYYGSIENYGSIEIVDTTGELVDMIKDGVIDNSNTNLEIITNEQVIQTHISTDSSFDINTKVLSLDLGNKINSLDILRYKGYTYPNHSENFTNVLFDVLSSLKYLLGTEELTEEEFKNMLSDKYDSTHTLYDYLANLPINYPMIEPNKTYREVIDQFCVVAQMQMFIDDSGNIKFVSARPKNFDENVKLIHIPKSNMFSQLNYNLFLKNKYDGVEISRTKVNDTINYNTNIFNSETIDLSDKTINNYPYITDSELYNKIDGVFNYAQEIDGNSLKYICHKYYYETYKFSVPKKKNNNLEQVLSIKNYLTSDSSKSYNLTYTKTIGAIGGEYNSSTQKLYGIGRDEEYSPEFNPNASVEEGNGLFDGSISYANLKLDDEDASWVEIESEDNDFYYVSIKVCVSLEKFWIWRYIGSSSIAGNVTRGEFTKYIPKNLTINVYGSKREISFEQLQSNTANIELAKTKVSLESNVLMQNERTINNIKNNILKDYSLGISSGSVNVSCSDYYDSNGNKVVDWTNGDVLRVGDIVYFDNDKYNDNKQRYWRIKGRTFRKAGVPMQDLELEEIKPKKELERCTWQEISKLSELDASSELSIGDTKQFTLTDGTILTATIVDFNKDKTSNNKYSGITFAVENLTQTSAIGTYSTGGVLWSNSIIRNEFLPNIYNKLPSDLQKYIKPVIKVTYAGKNTEQTEDALWLFGRKEIYYPSELNEGNTYEYFKDSDNIKNVFKYSDSTMQYWLRTVTNESNNNYNNYVEIGEQKLPPPLKPIPIINFNTTLSSTNKYNIVFGFCI
jgi:hypothetical protein